MIGKDSNGIILKYPARTCKYCKKYPCFTGINICKCDFAQYGCLYFKDIRCI